MPQSRPSVRGLLVLTVAAGLTACSADTPAPGNPTRETLPNGAILVRYPDLPAIDSIGPAVTDAQVDLRFGSLEGDDANFIFGEIRGIQAASDGTIYVADNQALEVRVFSPQGEYLRTIVRRGEGPGEILRTNGITLSGDTLLWVNETRQWAVIGVDPTGEELRRFTSPVLSRGYIWDGHGGHGFRLSGRTRLPRVHLPGGGREHILLPDPLRRIRDRRRTPHRPDAKPMIESFFVDDEGRLWVQRATPHDAFRFHDLFSEDGDYLGSVRLGFHPAPYVPIRVQHGDIYTWVVDEMDVQYVVRAPLR